jgi:SpoVK/Ycf46/Vps4 family AAA+-type ATPase
MLALIPSPNLHSQPTALQDLAKQLAQVQYQSEKLAVDQRAGAILPQDYAQQVNQNALAYQRAHSRYDRLPPDEQAQVSRLEKEIHDKLAANLQAEWAQINAKEHKDTEQTRAALLRERQNGNRPTAPPVVPPLNSGPGATASQQTPKTTVPPWRYATSDSSTSYWWLLLLGPAAAIAYAVWRFGRKGSRPKDGPIGAGAQRPPIDLTLRPAPATPAQTQASSPAALPAASGASLRERMFAQVRAKYQAGVAEAMDSLTAAQLALQANAEIPQKIREELQRIGGLLHAAIEVLLLKRVSNTNRAFRAALLLKPLRLRLKDMRVRFPLIGLVVGIIVISWGWSELNKPLVLLVPNLVSLYVVAVGLSFFFERRAQTKAAMGALAKSGAALKFPALSYVYAEQAPVGTPGAFAVECLSIQSAPDRPVMAEETLGNQADAGTVGNFFLGLNKLGTYHKAVGGPATLVAVQPDNALMSNYSAVVTEALTQHAPALDPLLQAMKGYGDLKWRERLQGVNVRWAEALLGQMATLEKVWQPVSVTDSVFEFLMKRIDLFNMRDNATPRGLLLYGYPGNGKEFLARAIAASTFAKFVKPTADQLASAQGIRDFWAAQSGRGKIVLFVDYADKIFARAGDNEGAGREAILAWMEEWSRNEPGKTSVWVVMSAESDQNLHPRVLQELGGSKIEIKTPDESGRTLIIATAGRECQLPGTLPRWLTESTSGASVRDLRQIVSEARMQSVPAAPTEDQWRTALRTVLGDEGALPSLQDLVLPAATLTQLQGTVAILRDAERLRAKGVKVPHILLFGPAGTGKTQIAKALANDAKRKLLSASTADLKAQYQGQGARLMRDQFERARAKAPCVLFLDEMESVAPRRGPAVDANTSDGITEMLTQMQQANSGDRVVMVIGATNLPDAIDSAVLDRFTHKIPIPPPDDEGRKELLRREIAKRSVDADLDVDEITTLLAKGTKGKSGRELGNLVDRAMELAVQRALSNGNADHIGLTREDLERALRPKVDVPSKEKLDEIWGEVVLVPEVKAQILAKIGQFNRGDKAAPRGLLLYGPPGTGKTEIARRVADSTGGKFLSLKAPDLKAGYLGQCGERVKKHWEEARQYPCCVMFVDECDAIFARRGGLDADKLTEEVVGAFLPEWDGMGTEQQRVWVIGATNRDDLLDEAIVQRFGATVKIDLPGPLERLRILALEVKKLDRTFEVPEFLGQETTGMSGRQLMMLVREVCALADAENGRANEATWRAALKRGRRGGPQGPVEGPLPDWEHLILDPNTKDKLKTLCASLKNLEKLRQQGIPIPTGALLYGPPGTGKTQVARTLAHQGGLGFIAAGVGDMKGAFIGHCVKKTHELFERARAQAPCILFIDEIDAACPDRDGRGADQFTIEIVNQFLEETDGVKSGPQVVYVLGATNRPEAIDKAVRSRLKQAIEIPLPNDEDRRLLIMGFLSRLKVDFKIEEVAAELARKTKRKSGRDLKGLIEGATQRAVQRAMLDGGVDNIVLTADDLWQELRPAQVSEKTKEQLDEIWRQIVLPAAVKAELRAKIDQFNRADKAAPRGLLLYGPPGTGKTEIARRIAESTGGKFMELTGPDLKAGFVGQGGERVKKCWEEARQYPCCVMFVDECDAVFSRRGGLEGDKAIDEVVGAFLPQWDGMASEGQRVWVVGATNRNESLDEAIVQRFGATVKIDLPGPLERLEILKLEIKKLDRAFEVPEFLGSETTGMSGRILSVLAREVCAFADTQGGVADESTWRAALARHTKAGGTAVKGEARWETLVVPEETLENLQTVCDTLKNLEEFKAQGFNIPRGLLLYGPPGTGKTQIARTMANESGLTFIAASTADLKAPFTGQSSKKTHEQFERARSAAPCILFIDEIDAACPTRGGPNADTFTDEIVVQMLQEMEGAKAQTGHVFVLAATNRPDVIDIAVQSRLETKILIDKPNRDARQRLFRQMLSKQRADFDRDAVAAELADLTAGLAGRGIEDVIRGAEQRAIRRFRAAKDPNALMLTRADLLSEVPGGRPAGRPADRPADLEGAPLSGRPGGANAELPQRAEP